MVIFWDKCLGRPKECLLNLQYAVIYLHLGFYYIDTFICENSLSYTLLHWTFYVCYMSTPKVYFLKKSMVNQGNTFHTLVMRCHSKLPWNNGACIDRPNGKSDRRDVWVLKPYLPCTSEISLFSFEHLVISGAPGARPKFIVLWLYRPLVYIENFMA